MCFSKSYLETNKLKKFVGKCLGECFVESLGERLGECLCECLREQLGERFGKCLEFL